MPWMFTGLNFVSEIGFPEFDTNQIRASLQLLKNSFLCLLHLGCYSNTTSDEASLCPNIKSTTTAGQNNTAPIDKGRGIHLQILLRKTQNTQFITHKRRVIHQPFDFK